MKCDHWDIAIKELGFIHYDRSGSAIWICKDCGAKASGGEILLIIKRKPERYEFE